eukprot:7028181-Prymnesium_polylepis.1
MAARTHAQLPAPARGRAAHGTHRRRRPWQAIVCVRRDAATEAAAAAGVLCSKPAASLVPCAPIS